MIQKFLLAFLFHFLNLHEILRRMVYSLMVLEARFSPQEPLKVKLPTEFQGVDFSISENSSAGNVLICENKKNHSKMSKKIAFTAKIAFSGVHNP